MLFEKNYNGMYKLKSLKVQLYLWSFWSQVLWHVVFLIYFIYERFELILLVGPYHKKVDVCLVIFWHEYIYILHIVFIAQSLICRFIFLIQKKTIFPEQFFSASKEASSSSRFYLVIRAFSKTNGLAQLCQKVSKHQCY